jgi:outer membrane protein
MKQILLVLAVFCTAVTAAQAQKIGHINSQVILSELPEVKAAESDLEAFQTQLQKKGQKMIEDFQKRYQEVARKEQQGELSPRQLEEESKKLKTEEETIQKFEQEMQLQIMTKREELLQPILDRVNDAIEKVSKEKGYSYIIDLSAGMLLYAEDSFDITNEVKKILGL